MKDLTFSFQPWWKEIIYDDHGGHCPVRTDYNVYFSANGIGFWAWFDDIGKHVSINVRKTLECLAYVKGLKSADTNEAETIIKNAFTNNDKLKTFVATHGIDVVPPIKPFDLGYEWD